jgi:hypothetical protein
MEAERLRLHDFACRMGIGHDATLKQSQLLDKMVVAYMKKRREQEKCLRLQP